jgi:hypothetical protein
VTRMLAEMRALREGIIIADQLPTAVAAEVVKNTNIKIAHRLVSADDRKEIGQAMLLDGSQMEEIARLNTGESFLYMEGWYRPHLVKIPLENSAKTKLGIENSITSAQITTLIQPQSWYRQSQATLLATALQEHTRLYQKYNQTFSSIRTETEQVNQTCENLRSALVTLTQSIFYRLTGELTLVLDPPPNDEPKLRSDKRLDASNLRSLKNLQPSLHLTLKDLLEIQSNLTDQLAEFDDAYQAAITTNNRIPRQKYQQQWQSLHRQINTVHYQITDLATMLNQLECLPPAQQQLAEIDYMQQSINSREEPALRKTFERLNADQQSLQNKMIEVVNRAIEQAKINKAIHDLNLGGL